MSKYIKRALLLGSIFVLTGASGSTELAPETLRISPPAPYGENPRWNKYEEDSVHVYKSYFRTEYFVMIYIKFSESEGEKGLAVRHAYFKSPNDLAPSPALLQCAIQHLAPNRKPPFSTSVCTPATSTTERPWKCPGGPIFENFECFKFGAPTRVYALIDNADVVFNENIPLSFTPFRANVNFGDLEDPKLPEAKDIMAANRSFYNARIIPFIIPDREILYFENHFNGKDGKPIPTLSKEETEYSINFNLHICGTQPCIPMIIDPGSGNGLGYPP